MSESSRHTNGYEAASALDDPHVLSGPFWGELRVFLAVAKAKSFNRAAEELNMSQPTVSRQVRRLQDVMGTQLVVPTQAGIKLTRQGQELAKSLLDLDQKLFDISNDLCAETRTAEGLVRLAVSEGLAGVFLAPHIVSFSERFPKIRLQLRTPTNLQSPRENQSDVMLGMAPSFQGEIASRPLGFLHLLPICTRPYIERYGVPTRRNLGSHCFIQCDRYSTPSDMWDAWHALLKRGVVVHSCDHSFSCAMVVKSGLGIGLLGNYVLAAPSAIPLDLGVRIRVPLYALAPTERLCAKPVRIVYDWISEIFSQSNLWFSPELNLESIPRESLSLPPLLNGPTQSP